MCRATWAPLSYSGVSLNPLESPRIARVPLSVGGPWAPLCSTGFPWVPLGSPAVPLAPQGSPGVPPGPVTSTLDSLGFLKVLLEIPVPPKGSRRFPGVSWRAWGPPRFPWGPLNSLRAHRLPWGPVGTPGFPCYPGPCGLLWGTLGSHGFPSVPSGFP